MANFDVHGTLPTRANKMANIGSKRRKVGSMWILASIGISVLVESQDRTMTKSPDILVSWNLLRM